VIKTIPHVCVAVLHTAGKHMEDSIVAAYVALLIGTIVQHNMVSMKGEDYQIEVHFAD